MLMKKKCDAEVNYRTMGGRRFGLTGRAQDHLVLCTGLEQPNVLFLYSFLDHWQVYSGIFLLHFHGFQKSACRLFPEPETMSLIVQVGFSFQNLLIQCICWRQHVVLRFDWHKSSWDFISCILPHRILIFIFLKGVFSVKIELKREKHVWIRRKQNFPSHFLVTCLDAACSMNKAWNYKTIHWSGNWNLLFKTEQCETTQLLLLPTLESTEVPLYRESSSSAELWGEIKLLPLVECMCAYS